MLTRDRFLACPRKRGRRSRSSTTSSLSPSSTTKSGSGISRCVHLGRHCMHCPSTYIRCLSQIIEKDPLQPNGPPQMSMVEIGPRFVLTPIRIFEGAFNGATVYSNPGTLTPRPAPPLTSLISVQSSSRRRRCGPRRGGRRATSMGSGRWRRASGRRGRRGGRGKKTSSLCRRCSPEGSLQNTACSPWASYVHPCLCSWYDRPE